MNIPQELILKQMEIGPLNNFLYFVGDQNAKEIAVVDPAWDVNFLCDEAKKLGYKITTILLTHGHHDHVNGLKEMLSRHDVPAYISKNEHLLFKPTHKNMKEIDHGTKIKIGKLEFEVISAPGHSPGCVCYRYKNVLIAGDAIFINGCGRCDLPGSDPKQQYHTLYNVIGKLPDDTLLFTGHNYGPREYDTLANQKRTNPYLTCTSEKEFLMQRMGI